MLSTEQIVDAKFLSVCPPTEAVQWLRAAARSSSIGGLNSLTRKDYSHQEQTLADRNDPYIDFGLARYGTSEAAGKIVYARGDLGIRCAYLAYFPGGGFGWRDNFELASSPPQELEELCALVKNPSLADETFKMCFESRGVFETLTDEAFQSVLVAVSDNERLMTPYDDKYMDGYADYSYHSVFEAAWKLTLAVLPLLAQLHCSALHWSGGRGLYTDCCRRQGLRKTKAAVGLRSATARHDTRPGLTVAASGEEKVSGSTGLRA
jgi:hypothetical protein